jgi:hypothetical protein
MKEPTLPSYHTFLNGGYGDFQKEPILSCFIYLSCVLSLQATFNGNVHFLKVDNKA